MIRGYISKRENRTINRSMSKARKSDQTNKGRKRWKAIKARKVGICQRSIISKKMRQRSKMKMRGKRFNKKRNITSKSTVIK